MKLSYNATAHRVTVLRRGDQRRVEMHVMDQHDAHTFVLLALSGSEGTHPDRERGMGPFHSREQAMAAVSALVAALSEEGFEPDFAAAAHWELVAARHAREIRTERLANDVSSEFVPLGVMPQAPDRDDA